MKAGTSSLVEVADEGEQIMWLITFILFLFIAAACAAIAQWLVPNRVPGGFLINAIVGVIGAWLGTSLMGSVGPSLMGVSLIPAILGSALFVFLLSLLFGMRLGRTA